MSGETEKQFVFECRVGAVNTFEDIVCCCFWVSLSWEQVETIMFQRIGQIVCEIYYADGLAIVLYPYLSKLS